MLSRHAESLFWAGRYLERAEDTARMLEVDFYDTLRHSEAVARSRWERLLHALRVHDDFEATGQVAADLSVTTFLVLDREHPGSIVSCVASARENLRTVRERIPNELWESTNRFHLRLSHRSVVDDVAQNPYRVFSLVKQRSQEIAGVASQSMARDQGYRFMLIGRMLERALMTCRLLVVRLDPEAEEGDDWLLTLSAVAGVEAYLRLGLPVDDGRAASSFLLQSQTFPRSVLFALRAVEDGLDSLGGEHPQLRRMVGATRSGLEFTEIDKSTGPSLERIEGLEAAIRSLAQALASAYFERADRSVGFVPMMLTEPSRAGRS